MKFLFLALFGLGTIAYGSDANLVKTMSTKTSIRKFWTRNTKQVVQMVQDKALQEGPVTDAVHDIIEKVFGKRVADFFILIIGTKEVEDSLIDIALAFQRISDPATCDDGLKEATGAIAYLSTYVVIQYLIIEQGVIIPIASDVAGRIAKTATYFMIDLFALDTKACKVIHGKITDCFPGDGEIIWAN